MACCDSIHVPAARTAKNNELLTAIYACSNASLSLISRELRFSVNLLSLSEQWQEQSKQQERALEEKLPENSWPRSITARVHQQRVE
jgi:hypothetical protein